MSIAVEGIFNDMEACYQSGEGELKPFLDKYVAWFNAKWFKKDLKQSESDAVIS